ncbi:MAG TPA: YIP1 family protein [Anaerolineae bacterium]|jgi:hypothetical protein
MQQAIVGRVPGIVTFKAPVYKEVASDATALQPAIVIVVVVAVLVGLISGLIGGNLIFNLVLTVVSQLISWALGSWVLAFVAKTVYKGEATTSQMLRVTGYTAIFRIIGIIPFLGFIGGILQAIANIIGVREANPGFDNTKAIITAIIAWVVIAIIIALVGFIFAIIFIGASAVGGSLNR